MTYKRGGKRAYIFFDVGIFFTIQVADMELIFFMLFESIQQFKKNLSK